MLIDSLVRAVGGVIIDIFLQNAAKMVLVDDQNMIETLFTHRTYPALCKRVSFGGLKGGVNNLDSFRDKHIVK